MPHFVAEERNPAASPGENKVPVADPDSLRELGATEFWPRRWEYMHRRHTLTDIMNPGYFTGESRERLHVGDEIWFTLCGNSKLPSEWQRGIAVVEEVPNEARLPVILAGFHRFGRPTPWRVAVTAEEDPIPETKGGKKSA